MSSKKQQRQSKLWPSTTSSSRYHTSSQQPHTCNLTTLVRSISTLRNSFYSPHHFPKFLLGFMTVSGIAGYNAMDYWYEKSVAQRNVIYSAAYHDHDGGVNVVTKKTTARESHHEKRKALFDKTERLTPYQLQQRRHHVNARRGYQEDEAVTATVAAPPQQTGVALQRQVTKFW